MHAARGRWPDATAALRTALAQHPDFIDAAGLLRRVEHAMAGAPAGGDS